MTLFAKHLSDGVTAIYESEQALRAAHPEPRDDSWREWLEVVTASNPLLTLLGTMLCLFPTVWYASTLTGPAGVKLMVALGAALLGGYVLGRLFYLLVAAFFALVAAGGVFLVLGLLLELLGRP